MTTLEDRTGTATTDSRRIILPRTAELHDRVRDETASIGEVVRDAARALPGSMFQPAGLPEGIAFQPRVLAAVLAYYYAIEVFASADVEGALRRDSAFLRVCGGEFPDARMLRRFRRYNREAVEHCLYAALRFLSHRDGSPHLEGELLAEVHERITNAILMDMHEN